VLPNLTNLEYALTGWAPFSSLDVTLYMIGQGSSDGLQLNETELLNAATLDSWLDTLQATLPGIVTVIYDGCQSGSFVSQLTPPTDKSRIVLASAGANQPACYIKQGQISFSHYFWSQVSNGSSVRDAWLHARRAIEFITQLFRGTPTVAQIDDDGNGIANEKIDGAFSRYHRIGTGIMLAGDDPIVGSVCTSQIIKETDSAELWAADVTTTGTIDKVWAVIAPPNTGLGSPSTPLMSLPFLDLTYSEGSDRFEGIFDGFTSFGTYGISMFAQDTDGVVSTPLTTTVKREFGSVKGDVNGDGLVDLIDVMISLKALSGMDITGLVRSTYASSGVDVNGDGTVGFAECIQGMQEVSGLR